MQSLVVSLLAGQSSLKTYTNDGILISSVVGSLKHKRQNAEEALTDQVEDGEDEEYYGPGTVAGQSGFLFDFDTGSADTFVPGPTCGPAHGCSGTVHYENTGTDEHNTTTVTYGSGQVSGENYYDTVTIAGLEATHQNIISLTTATGFSSSDSNSLMGMGFQSIAASGQAPYFKTLIDEGKVSTPEFSFYLGRAQDGTGDDSEMTLGGRDPAHFTGTPTTIAVSTPGYWQIPLDGVKVNNFEDPIDQVVDAGQAAIDTGTTIVLTPSAALLTIAARIPGAFPVPLALLDGEAEPLFLVYPCAENPDVAITFGGQDFAINPEDFNFGQLTPDLGSILGNNTLSSVLDEAAYCLASVAGFDIDPTENLYVVGDVFLKNWYSIFSYDGPSVSFAKSRA
ncbi:acid protease [Teratosphaeria nubilosa]|uniref:Acid protease n=1 Tax=Teratosphaeria nubilosa TaxID=161662 RepID=A0A6G1KYK8_9PEZI|nr:acid protease [Teratosphaeria nubilosa]